MKTYNILLFFSVVLVSCSSKLDIDPKQSLTPESALSSAENIQNLLVGAYDLAGQNTLFAGDYTLASELLANSGELAFRGTYLGPAEFNRKQVTSGNSFVRDYWVYSYAVSNQVNLVLEGLDKFDDPDEASRVEGEAKFLRAAVYFNLVKFFALPYKADTQNSQLGVPIVISAVSDASQITYPSRNSAQEVYDFVVSDLNAAVDLLPENNSFYADKYAAQALLARVYLQMGKYEGARDASNNVIKNSGYSLTADYPSAFNNESNSTEDVFAWQITTQDGLNDMTTFWATRIYGGRSLTGDVTIEPPYFTNFSDNNDQRSKFFYAGNGTLLSTKWQNQFANVPYIRLAEMYLIRAEANFRLATELGATPLEDINLIRKRSNATLFNSITLDTIISERKRELGFEDAALHDAKRLQKSIGALPYNSDQLVLPIPQREIDANKNLEQNPGYNN
ncbi:MAG: RagB/SusD family nutrient uptake outer membrane protein [Gelidibacter sp.]